MNTLRLDATDPLSEIVAKLDAFQPESLVAYASMARTLAEEQLAGRLRIAPQAVMCSSEVLTATARARIREAFGVEPFNVYAATETASIASECGQHRMHLYEDLVVTEVVDDRNRPVPPGTCGAKVLVTVLFSRTLPLIRYEMSDSPALSGQTCPCGRPFALLDGVQGRSDEILWLDDGHGKAIAVHPVVFHTLLAAVPAHGWQVVLEPARLRIEVALPGSGFDAKALADSIRAELRRAGTSPPPIEVVAVDAVRRGRTGKAPLVRTEAAP